MASTKQIKEAEEYNIPYYISQAKVAYRIADLMAILHVPQNIILQLLNSGELPSKMVGDMRLVGHKNLMTYLGEI